MDLTSDDGERQYETRANYKTVYVDPCTSVTAITIDGTAVDASDYTLKQNDRLNADWYNIVEFDTARAGEIITVDADWGFGSCPVEIQLLLAQLFNLVTVEQTLDNRVKSKKIEDFAVTYSDETAYDALMRKHKTVIDKYSTCNQGYIEHGTVYSIYDY
jgi:hypothetical protein